MSAFSASSSAQQVPVRELPKPAKEIDDPFNLILSARELSNGKLVVADPTDPVVSVVDFATGTRTAWGRKGAGPGEYTNPVAVFRLNGDTVWVIDAQSQTAGRLVAYLPDGKSGSTFPVVFINTADTSTISQPWGLDARGILYATSAPLALRTAGNAQDAGGQHNEINFADSATIVRMDLRATPPKPVPLARVRYFFNAGGMQQQVQGTNIKMTMAYPGMTPSDAWAVFPDGRIGIVRGANYRVEFINADGRRGVSTTMPFEKIGLTDADKKAELDVARQGVKQQLTMVKRMLPPGYTLDFELTPPKSWPAEYPAIAANGALAAPDGNLWVKRAIPERIGREQWDVISPAGKMVSRWQLPPKTTIIAIGRGTVYTVRTDQDDLRYVQRVVLPACKECTP